MKIFNKIFLINIITLLLISLSIGIMNSNQSYGTPISLLVVDIAFIVINMILAIVCSIFVNSETGKAFLICAGWLMLIGPATCVAVLFIFS